jgi:hypothetical protein
MPMTTLYQPRGKEHIKYIRRLAMRLWGQNYDYDDTEWRQSMRDAMLTHRTYLITGLKMSKAELDSYWAKRELVRQQHTPPTGIWWRNQETNAWEPLVV